jgi:hypothetical protein
MIESTHLNDSESLEGDTLIQSLIGWMKDGGSRIDKLQIR